MNNKIATLANFNCTFKAFKETYPLLDYFEEIFWPAINDKSLIRTTKKNGKVVTKFHLSDVQLVELKPGIIALVGRHIKRTLLEISPDYDVEKGFIGESDERPSAPYATFILLLNNHRIIYIPEKTGAPDIRSFSSTMKIILEQYVRNLRKQSLRELKKNDFIFEGIKYENITQFNLEYIVNRYPFPELNVIPIESPHLVDELFEKIYSIKDVRFKFYKPNNDPLNFDDFFEHAFSVVENTGSSNVEIKLSNPTENKVIEKAVKKSKGKTDYKINAIGENSEKIILIPDKVTKQVSVEINEDEKSYVEKAVNIYEQVQEQDVLIECSDDNMKKYRQMFEKLKLYITGDINGHR